MKAQIMVLLLVSLLATSPVLAQGRGKDGKQPGRSGSGSGTGSSTDNWKPETGNRIIRDYALELDLVNIFVIRNDSDFDDSKPVYNEYGQSEGFLGTFLQPRLRIGVSRYMRFYYETEIGLDLWSEKNPDHALGTEGGNALGIKQREIWGEFAIKKFRTKVGYQRVKDVSGLFVNHWIGNVRLGVGKPDGTGIFASVGQLPDQTHEGWEWGDIFGNFSTDLTLYGLDGGWEFNENIRLAGGAYYLHDGTVIGRLRQVLAAGAALHLKYPSWYLSLSGLFQYGWLRDGSADLSDATILGWGATLEGGYRYKGFVLKGAATILSADDAYDHNAAATGFLYSGKRPGMSILMTENYTRDLGDNLDEDLGVYDGWFFEMRPGLLGFDLGLYLQTTEWLNVGLVSALMIVLNPDNAGGHRFFGSENELVLDITPFGDLLHLEIVGGILIPGGAAAAVINHIDLEATELLWFGQAALVMHF